MDFEMEDIDYSALFNPDGQLLMYKQDIRIADLPTAVTGRIAERFPDCSLHVAKKSGKGTTIYYQVGLDGQLRGTKAVYTPRPKPYLLGLTFKFEGPEPFRYERKVPPLSFVLKNNPGNNCQLTQ